MGILPTKRRFPINCCHKLTSLCKVIGSRSRILYGLCKVHKAITDVYPPFRCILSVIRTPSYRLAKFLLPKLPSIRSNEFTMKDSIAFAEEIIHQDDKFFMGNFDVNSLFANYRYFKIPLKETINICTNCYITI